MTCMIRMRILSPRAVPAEQNTFWGFLRGERFERRAGVSHRLRRPGAERRGGGGGGSKRRVGLVICKRVVRPTWQHAASEGVRGRAEGVRGSDRGWLRQDFVSNRIAVGRGADAGGQSGEAPASSAP